MTTNPEQPSHGVRHVQIEPDEAGQRIDNYLIRILKGVPKSRIYRIMRKGEVRVNKKRVKPEYRLSSGDEVRVPPVRLAEPKPAANPEAWIVKQIESSILHEDDRLMVLNKPHGLAVHGGSGQSYGLIEALRASRPDAHYLELVHRLDKDTSGCLLIAKRRSALRHLHEQIRENSINKTYRALLCGRWKQGTHTVKAALHKNTLQSGERVVRVDPNGKAAKTTFRLLEAHPLASYMDIELHTGRTHQIRVHAAHAGHPVAGDGKYGDKQCNQQLRKQGLNRMFLHAYRLVFKHPKDEHEMDIVAPVDDALLTLINKLPD